MLGKIQWEQYGVVRFEAQIINTIEREETLLVEYENGVEKIKGVLELSLHTLQGANASFCYRYDGRFDGTAVAEGTLDRTAERVVFRGLWRVPGNAPCTWSVHCEYTPRPTIRGRWFVADRSAPRPNMEMQAAVAVAGTDWDTPGLPDPQLKAAIRSRDYLNGSIIDVPVIWIDVHIFGG